MGLILDSSVAIAAERRGDTVQVFLHRVIETAGDQEAALSAVGVVELIHGIHRADTPERQARREAFVEELLAAVANYPLTTDPGALAWVLCANRQSAPFRARPRSVRHSALRTAGHTFPKTAKSDRRKR